MYIGVTHVSLRCHPGVTQAYGATVQVSMTRRCSLLLLLPRTVLGWRRHPLLLLLLLLQLHLCFSLPSQWMLQHTTELLQLAPLTPRWWQVSWRVPTSPQWSQWRLHQQPQVLQPAYWQRLQQLLGPALPQPRHQQQRRHLLLLL
jgi:hypothetical protein